MEIFPQCESVYCDFLHMIIPDSWHIDYALTHPLTQNLESAISDVGKSVLPEHLLLVANCLSVTGEFVGLNAKGWKRQREHASVLSPFVQACFSVSSHCIFSSTYMYSLLPVSSIIHRYVLKFVAESW